MTDLGTATRLPYSSAMCPGNDNQIDWTAAATPQDDRVREGVLPSLTRPRTRAVPQTRHSVMNTLLGENDLTALDASGSDPYNSTGRQFRR